jgi:hypothetical protein
MALTQVERERISDSRQKVQSVANSLKHVDPRKVPHHSEIEECLEDAEDSLREALRSSPPNPSPGAPRQ